MVGIYRIRNVINNKCYYGSAKQINRRWTRHKSQLKYKRHENVVLQRAWNKYGEKNFVFEVVEECNENELLFIEQKYLDLKPEYNIGKTSNGGDNITNHPNKEEIIKQIVETINNNTILMSEEERKQKWGRNGENNPNWKGGVSIKYCKCGKKIRVINKTCSKCRDRSGKNNPFHNKKHTEKMIKAMSDSKKGKYFGEQNIEFMIDGVKYLSLGEASNKLSIPTTTIRWRLKSKNKKFNNYKYI